MGDGDKMSDSNTDRLIEEVSEFRESLVQRLDRVNSLTESEVMGAAGALGTIVSLASNLSNDTKTTLAGVGDLENEDGDSLAKSIAKQSSTTEEFVSALQSQMASQKAVAAEAFEQSQAIRAAARAVENLSHQATMLAINAMIEAGRIGQAGAGFVVIGKEMQWLSVEIKKTNTLVSGLAEKLSALLPNIATMIESTASHTDEFSETIKDSISDVRDRSVSLQGGVSALLVDNQSAIDNIVYQSNEALSHLQFQDAVAQGLMRLDSMARDLVVTVGTLSGKDMGEQEIREVAHVEVGGEKEISPDDAGEVMLF